MSYVQQSHGTQDSALGPNSGAPPSSMDQPMALHNPVSPGADVGGDSSVLRSRSRTYSQTLHNAPSKHFSTASTTTTANKTRASRQMLESQLPRAMRGNLPKYDARKNWASRKANGHFSSPPPPPPFAEADEEQGYGRGARHHSHAYQNYLSHWWHSSNKENHEAAVNHTLRRRLLLKNILVAAVSEFIGTFFFLFFALAINTTTVVAKSAQAPGSAVDLSALLVSSLGFGFSLAISAWVFFRVSGGVQNPAITLALTLTGALNWIQCVVLTIVQFAGGIAAAALVSGLYPGQVDSGTRLNPETTVNQGFWLEFFMSAQLIFTVLMLAAEKHRATFLAPVGIGLALFITQLLGQPYTGASVNPARTLGPDVASKSFPGYTWIYYIASYAAAIVVSGFYHLLKWVRYETATPDQDADEHQAGQMRQVLLDANGDVIGTLDILTAEEFDAHHAPETEESEQTNVDNFMSDEEKAAQQGLSQPPSSSAIQRINSTMSMEGGDHQHAMRQTSPLPSVVVPSQPAITDRYPSPQRNDSVASSRHAYTAGSSSKPSLARYQSASSELYSTPQPHINGTRRHPSETRA